MDKWIPEGLPKEYHEIFQNRVLYHVRKGLPLEHAQVKTWSEYYQKHSDEFGFVTIIMR
jgi:hypothetical protein